MNKNGVEVLSEVVWERGARSLYFPDPDGYLIRPDTLVRVQANKLRARLEEYYSGLWSESYDQDLKDVFDIQKEISRSIAGVFAGLGAYLGDFESAITCSVNDRAVRWSWMVQWIKPVPAWRHIGL